jgi:hypothetical protein
MQELLELINAINTDRFRSCGLWSFVLEEGSPMERLYTALYEGHVSTDEQAMALLFPGKSDAADIIALRDGLTARLLEVILLLEFNIKPSSDRQKAYQACTRHCSEALLLLSKNVRGMGIAILKEVLKQSIYYEFTDLTLSALATLRLHAGATDGDRARYRQYQALYRKYQDIWMMENEAEDAYTYLTSFGVEKSSGRTLSEAAQAYYERLQPYLAKSDTFRLHVCGRMVETMIYSSRNDHVSFAASCESAIAFFRRKKFETTLPLQAFYYQLILCYIQLEEFEKGEAIMRHYQSVFREGSFNWFKLQELYFLLAVYTRHYDKAHAVVQMVEQKLRSESQSRQLEDMWEIYRAFVQFLSLSGVFELSGKRLKAFRPSSLSCEIPVFAPEKRGINIPLLIVQILFDLLERKYDQATVRIAAIQQYNSGRSIQQGYYRSRCFIRALGHFPVSAYHPKGVSRAVQPFLKQLRAHPLDMAFQTHEVEMMPYERLLELAVATLSDTEGTSK